ncbi:hypothetical protein LCGC14_1918190 [marine sediment metagenome]|uniref:Uncharacterized protein n=1 Tax=marine sediment metagenome TaxID=412755 RepID=A0A0F9I5K0_9ZZZZ
MKKLIILVLFLLLASPAMAFESGMEAFSPNGAEFVLDSEGRYGSAAVVSIGHTEDGYLETIILFADGSGIRGGGSATAIIFATIGSESLANDINISLVVDDAGQLVGVKLQR